jgi:hypothetical protein
MFHCGAILVGSFLTTILPSLVSADFAPHGVWNGMTWDDFLSSRTQERIPPQARSHHRVLEEGKSEPILADHFGGEAGFYHGVASGDPLEDRVILWTKYTPVSVDESVVLQLRIAEVTESINFDDHLDPQANPYLWTANIETTAETDYIAKVDVTGLVSNTHFVFAFTDGNVVSDVGQTRTAPSPEDDVEELNYCFFSCANFLNGYFHPYDVGSTMEDLDFWIHLGDYIYEYAEPESIALVSTVSIWFSTMLLSLAQIFFFPSRHGSFWIFKTIEIDMPHTINMTKDCETYVAGHRSLPYGMITRYVE